MKPFPAALPALLALCLSLPLAADIPDSVALERFLDPGEVPLERPVWFGGMPGKPGVFVALEQHTGKVVVIRRVDGAWTRQDFLDEDVKQEGECGLLGIAFHPDFPVNRKYYLNYNPAAGELATLVVERVADTTFLRDSGKSGRQILRIPQPKINHNGGTLAFGPRDGMLYIGMGDGGDVLPAQDLGEVLGKMLRIDVDGQAGGHPYRIPPDNPFVDRAGARPEIWAYGLRNPWKWSFDPATGNLWAGDVGETRREEISLVGKGDNLGWPIREGSVCRDGGSDCPAPEGELVDPVLDLGRERSQTIVGGLVFRGNPASPFFGLYFFADFLLQDIFALRHEPGKPVEYKRVASSPARVSSFGTDHEGNIYVVGHDNGTIYRLAGPGMGSSGVRPAIGPGPRMPGFLSISRGRTWRLPGAREGSRIDIVSRTGKTVATLTAGPGNMAVPDIAPGLYFARLRTASRVEGWSALLVQ